MMRFVSYNLLSSALSTPKSFPTTKAHLLDAQTRLEDICIKFKDIIANSSDNGIETGTIFGLQEISLPWVGPLRSFFQQHGYEFVHSCYGSRFNGYMGVAIAFPMRAHDLRISRLEMVCPPQQYGDVGFQRWKQGQKKSNTAWYRKLVNLGKNSLPFRPLIEHFQTPSPRPPQTMIACRFNRAIFGLLHHPDVGAVAFGTYHMPCMFRYPKVMAVHALLFFHALREYCHRCGVEDFVVMMDANFQPGSLPYRAIAGYLTQDELDAIDATNPGVTTLRIATDTVGRSQTLSDFLVDIQHVYPDNSITNYTHGFAGEFVGKIDYIWYKFEPWSSDATLEVEVDAVKAPTEYESNQSNFLPNASEPSDHYMLSGILSMIEAL
jgi:hypothetical protein